MNIFWKITGLLLVLYSIIGGFLMPVPRVDILNESIRNLYFHVPMWFSMILIMLLSFIYSVRFLAGYQMKYDIAAREAVNTGFLFGLLGLATGSIWAKVTWGAFWVGDVRLNGAAITMLVYLAYMILRGSVEDDQKRARLAAVYNIFAYIMLIIFLIVYPRMSDSLHPGAGGNPGFSIYDDDLDSRMRSIFYPAVIGWILVGLWLMNIQIRIAKLKENSLNL